MKKTFAMTAVLVLLLVGAVQPLRAAMDPHIRTLTQEALRLYSENQFIQALDLFKQIERIDPGNTLAKEYIPKTEKSILEWEESGSPEAAQRPRATWDSLLNKSSRGVPQDVTDAKDIIAARKSLVERMRNRATNIGNIVQIKEDKRGLDVTLFHDQLFLPGLLILRDEALPILENVAQLMRQKADRSVQIKSMARTDSTDPFLLFPDFPVPAPDPSVRSRASSSPSAGPSFSFTDIEANRSFILFTHLAQRSMGQPTLQN